MEVAPGQKASPARAAHTAIAAVSGDFAALLPPTAPVAARPLLELALARVLGLQEEVEEELLRLAPLRRGLHLPESSQVQTTAAVAPIVTLVLQERVGKCIQYPASTPHGSSPSATGD